MTRSIIKNESLRTKHVTVKQMRIALLKEVFFMNRDSVTGFEPCEEYLLDACEWEEGLPASYEEFLYGLQKSVYGQDEELMGIAYDIYAYLRGISEGNPAKHNFILAGPSGSGKTELFRTVKRLLKQYGCPVPVLQLDLSGLSPTGFQGEETSVIPEMILNAGSSGAAIVFLDEFDKALMPLCGANGSDVNRVVQYELLTLVEGRVCSVRQNGKMHLVDTNQTLFIGTGAFTDYREAKVRKQQETPIGFSTETAKRFREAKVDTPKIAEVELTMKDLRQAGSAVELAGRFDSIYNFRPIEAAVFHDLFQHFVEDLAIEQEVLIRASKAATKDFFSLAQSEFGCREVKRVLYNTVKPCLIKIADETDRISYCIEIHNIGKAELKRRTKSVRTAKVHQDTSC